MTYKEMGKLTEKCLTHTQKLAKGDPAVGVNILMLALCCLTAGRAERAATHDLLDVVWDEVYGETLQ